MHLVHLHGRNRTPSIETMRHAAGTSTEVHLRHGEDRATGRISCPRRLRPEADAVAGRVRAERDLRHVKAGGLVEADDTFTIGAGHDEIPQLLVSGMP